MLITKPQIFAKKIVPLNNIHIKAILVIMTLCQIVCVLYRAAARAAVHRFIQSSESSLREKDLLKSVKVGHHRNVHHQDY